MNTCSHLVEFFRADERLIERVTDFLQQGFEAGNACIAVITSAHRRGVDRELAARGLSSEELIADYRYIVMDAAATLKSIRPNGTFESGEFYRSLGQLISLASAGGKSVRIVGEMVALLAEAGEGGAAIQLEEMWNELSRIHRFTLLCVYPESAFASPLGQRQRRQIIALHDGRPDDGDGQLQTAMRAKAHKIAS